MHWRMSAFGLLLMPALAAVAQVVAAVTPPPEMVGAARVFLDSLSAEERKRAQFPFDSEERFNWFFTPVDRRGLPLKELSETQRAAAMSLLRTGLSEQGYRQAETIRALEDVLVEMGGNPRVRDGGLYYFTIFGDPGSKTTWAWRYEGHHLSLHWTLANGSALATAPRFFGANPAEVRQGGLKGIRPLATQEDLAYELLGSFDATQRKAAIIDARAPDDILSSNRKEAAMQDDRGISFAELAVPQRELLIKLIAEHASATVEGAAKQRMAEVRSSRLDLIRFAWMGGIERGQGHYYRIQGPTFLIEFDNTQNDANHIHTVWREFKGDFGRDLLSEHYQSSAHASGP